MYFHVSPMIDFFCNNRGMRKVFHQCEFHDAHLSCLCVGTVVTIHTAERFFTSVTSTMQFQFVFSCIPFVTIHTDERFFTGVNSNMPFQAALLTEFLVTLRTCERFLTGVSPKMNIQEEFMYEHFVTFQTGE